MGLESLHAVAANVWLCFGLQVQQGSLALGHLGLGCSGMCCAQSTSRRRRQRCLQHQHQQQQWLRQQQKQQWLQQQAAVEPPAAKAAAKSRRQRRQQQQQQRQQVYSKQQQQQQRSRGLGCGIVGGVGSSRKGTRRCRSAVVVAGRCTAAGCVRRQPGRNTRGTAGSGRQRGQQQRQQSECTGVWAACRVV